MHSIQCTFPVHANRAALLDLIERDRRVEGCLGLSGAVVLSIPADSPEAALASAHRLRLGLKLPNERMVLRSV
jgi:hypothetical protein